MKRKQKILTKSMEIIISHCKKKTKQKTLSNFFVSCEKKSLLYQNVLIILGRERSPYDAVIVNLFLFFLKRELTTQLVLLLNSEERKKGFATTL